MNRIKIFFICLTFFGCTAGEHNETVLKSTDTEKIVYSAHRKYGYNIVAARFNEHNKMRYVFVLNGNGVVMAVFRNRLISLNEVSGKSQYLVSDTSNNNIHGPGLYGYPIQGYYPEAIQHDSVKHFVCKISLSEIIFFRSVDSLMKKNNKTFRPVDSMEKLYWFNYDFSN